MAPVELEAKEETVTPKQELPQVGDLVKRNDFVFEVLGVREGFRHVDVMTVRGQERNFSIAPAVGDFKKIADAKEGEPAWALPDVELEEAAAAEPPVVPPGTVTGFTGQPQGFSGGAGALPGSEAAGGVRSPVSGSGTAKSAAVRTTE